MLNFSYDDLKMQQKIFKKEYFDKTLNLNRSNFNLKVETNSEREENSKRK